jgi:hypothetical protein
MLQTLLAAAENPRPATTVSPIRPIPADAPSGKAPASVSPIKSISGQQLVAEAARRIAMQPALAARIRQQASLFGQELVGSGQYQQVLDGDRILVRLELKLQVDGETLTLQQINDGSVMWIRRDQGAEKKVAYVNVRRVRGAAQAAHGSENGATGKPASESSSTVASSAGAVTAGDALALGGLPQLLQGLDRNFDFGPVREDMLGRVPVWVVSGKWKSGKLTESIAHYKEDSSSAGRSPADLLPPHLPDRVTVVLGRDDFVPLFPYRIEYSRSLVQPADEAEQGRAGERDADSSTTIVKVEFFEVRRQWDIDVRTFRYPYGDQAIEDHTELYMRRLGLLKDPPQSK